ncbi:N-acetyllactosaminide beta-1,6-N-acetylglucosaminyl-transferase-like [Haliotis rufescens]|uniref:N-acetyllactosaminide beta-1,6-N-acetylglucosaminyl-transferase-like n=1 Tax=Haliotis rufescens TaxID=6454 RepID=UPI00201F2239|nr:N-acetyllactosaminide beta-1,6-N-acetylglucosaminyl-transferase-like [Haliotis rufescens]
MIRRKLYALFALLILCFSYKLYVELTILLVHEDTPPGSRRHVADDVRQPKQHPCFSDIRGKKKFQCQELVRGRGFHAFANQSLSNKRLHQEQDCDFLVALQDCESLREQHGYLDKPVALKEKHFAIAYTIKVHKSPRQVEQLLRNIYRPHNVYCVHVDGSSRRMFQVMKQLSECFHNVIVIQKINVVYFSIGLLQTDLVCMEELLKSNIRWKYYINLAGQEFPLKTNLEIVEILQALNGTNDIEAYPFPDFIKSRYLTHKYIENGVLKRSHIPKEPFKHNITFYKGSMYGMFSRKFVEFVMTGEIARDFVLWLNDTFAPEEMMWGTLNALPDAPGGYSVVVDHKKGGFLSRAMVWKDDDDVCEGEYVHGVCVFSFRDLPWLSRRPEVVANKVDVQKDQVVIDCLEEALQARAYTGNTSTLDWTFYNAAPHMHIHRN